MTLLTLFSAPKPFTNSHIAMIQRNAIKSWTLLPDVEVVLLGKEEGLAEAAQEFGVKHVPHVASNRNGPPFIMSMFEIARDASERSNSELLCIINADMILMSDFVEAAKQAVKLKDKFVLLSQRWDYDVTTPLDFTEGWEVEAGGICQKTEPASSSRWQRFFPLPKILLYRHPAFHHRSRWLGQLDDLQSPQGKLAGDRLHAVGDDRASEP